MADAATRQGPEAAAASPPPSAVVDAVAAGTLDAELAALAWTLVAAHVPATVAGSGPAAERVLDAVAAMPPADTHRQVVDPAADTLEWLPHATDLGWPGPARPTADGAPPMIRPDTTAIRIDLDLAPTDRAAGEVGRIVIRAASIGYGLLATIPAASLEDVLARLGGPPVAATPDELSRLGVVLVVDDRRVTAAHYLRPTARDEHGHVQRLGPAVLATWDPALGRFEHFGWGILPELARRIGQRAGDLEMDLDRRAAMLA